MSKLGFTFFLLLGPILGYAQHPFSISLDPVSINNMGGIQSFAVAQHDGKWLIIGGRLDGLHQRQPWASFDLDGHNKQLIVIDPDQEESWSASLDSLDITLQDQLSSTNMAFYQEGHYLYFLGGYGYSNTAEDHITYPGMIAIDVPELIDAIMTNQSISSYFRKIEEDQFAIAGGRLLKMYNTYYLVGGHRFDGRYNPMGHPTHVQTYTNAVRRFKIEDDGTIISIQHLASWVDSVHLHRRDFNVVPCISSSEEEALTAFSGVFQYDVDLPYLTSVYIDSLGYQVNDTFFQLFNHYHCANVGLYDDAQHEMHTIFFGGIAQFYENDGVLVQDNDVPFVNTIARVTRHQNGSLTEYKLPIEMPALLGAGSEFIPNIELPQYQNGVIKLDSLSSEPVVLGHIVGGIYSSEKNVFWVNDGTQSEATKMVFKVILQKNPITHHANPLFADGRKLGLQIFPNPSNGVVNVRFYLTEAKDIQFLVHDLAGKKLMHVKVQGTQLQKGENYIELDASDLNLHGTLLMTLQTPQQHMSQKVIVSE